MPIQQNPLKLHCEIDKVCELGGSYENIQSIIGNLVKVCKNKLNIVFQGYWKGISSRGHCDTMRSIGETIIEILRALEHFLLGERDLRIKGEDAKACEKNESEFKGQGFKR